MLSARTLTTTGHGAVVVPRDTAVLSVAAVHRAQRLADALAGAESARAALVEVARAHVEPTAIATQGLAMWPHHDAEGRPAGHEARHSLTIVCGDLGRAGVLLQSLVDETGDRLVVDGVALTARPGPDHLAAAREAAYADAHDRAEHLARLAGATLGAVVSITEGAPGPGLPRGLAKVVAAAGTEVALEGGVDEVAVSVTATWELG